MNNNEINMVHDITPTDTNTLNENAFVNTGTIENFTQNNYFGTSTQQVPRFPSIKYNLDNYNLLVTEDADLNNNVITFELDLNKCITERNTSQELRSKYTNFDDLALKEIKTFPTLLANKNQINYFKQTNTYCEQDVLFGCITDIKISRDKKVRITFQKDRFAPISQRNLNEMMKELDIKGNTEINELDKKQFSIKNKNIMTILQEKNLLYKEAKFNG